jgi:hypothetical protein
MTRTFSAISPTARAWRDGMHEDGNAEPRRDLERRTSLWSIDQEIAACIVDEESAQPEIADCTFGFARRPVAVICINRRHTMQL